MEKLKAFAFVNTELKIINFKYPAGKNYETTT